MHHSLRHQRELRDIVTHGEPWRALEQSPIADCHHCRVDLQAYLQLQQRLDFAGRTQRRMLRLMPPMPELESRLGNWRRSTLPQLPVRQPWPVQRVLLGVAATFLLVWLLWWSAGTSTPARPVLVPLGADPIQLQQPLDGHWRGDLVWTGSLPPGGSYLVRYRKISATGPAPRWRLSPRLWEPRWTLPAIETPRPESIEVEVQIQVLDGTTRPVQSARFVLTAPSSL